jgi:hypothetical protein
MLDREIADNIAKEIEIAEQEQDIADARCVMQSH